MDTAPGDKSTISDQPARPSTSSAVDGESALRIFISYRRDEAARHARLLYDRLAVRFGGENVFLDVVALKPGMDWLDEIRAQNAAPGALLALIGRRWAELMHERALYLG